MGVTLRSRRVAQRPFAHVFRELNITLYVLNNTLNARHRRDFKKSLSAPLYSLQWGIYLSYTIQFVVIEGL